MRNLIISETTCLENLSLEELILGKAQLKVLSDGYEELKVDAPDWVLVQSSAIVSEISRRTKDELLRRLKAAKARQASLLSRREIRQSVDAEVAELEARLK
ncbi:hypothetical protein A2619_04450 [candidate division WWE3 bacterium RIFOXYD1_FULL_39_9]|uniref:Uncharacterized protein n=1 Tax=candidate division WWE3 bacterium RIFOXYD1_FULL_39_9 TaxID=1802649 RepID=A0A1F4X6D9_UNCKA|nr:MAG: hypothetical protein A2619_04450 [candidate division WWE3 bacterium RIFOXYD1_FULL_39_9]